MDDASEKGQLTHMFIPGIKTLAGPNHKRETAVEIVCSSLKKTDNSTITT